MVFPIAGGTQDTGYEIDNSLRFNGSDDNAYLSDTFGSSTNVRKRTISLWVKRSKINDSSGHSLIRYDASGAGGELLFQGAGSGVGSNDQLFISNRNATSGSSDYGVRTNRLFRDVSAWYHIHIMYDTTESTASNRIKIFVNGVQETDLAQTDYPSQNYDSTAFLGGTSSAHTIGLGAPTGSANYFEGYMANYAFVDGSVLAATYFGETNDNGVWIPKNPLNETITWGNNGFFLEFQQTGTSANSSGKGADTSGEDNHWDDNAMTAEDITTDTPTNNFATLNPLQTITYPTLAEGNLVQTGHSSSDSAGIGATIMPANGKWYVEAKVPNISSASDGYPHFGITDTSLLSTRGTQGTKIAAGFKINDAASVTNTNILGTTTLTNTNWPSWSDDDIINFALDLDNRKLYIGKNGTYINSGNPAAGSNHQITWANSTEISLILAGYSVSSGSGGGGDNTSWNYGNPAFSISSGNADANGYGNFEYAPPSGYYAICTKNLAEYG